MGPIDVGPSTFMGPFKGSFKDCGEGFFVSIFVSSLEKIKNAKARFYGRGIFTPLIRYLQKREKTG
jgi:hypothetical protein